MVTFLTKGSTRKPIQRDILHCFHLCKDIKFNIQPVHLSREDFRIQEADEETRFFNPDDWSVDQNMFRKLIKGRPVIIDLFAHTSNAKASKFFSYGKCPDSCGTDAFAQNWEGESA